MKKVTVFEQMESNVDSVILINKFNIKPDGVNRFLKDWAEDARYFKQQPGFISAQLHRGIGGGCVFVNYAVWESTKHLTPLTPRKFSPSWKGIRRVLWHLLIYSRKSPYPASVKTESLGLPLF